MSEGHWVSDGSPEIVIDGTEAQCQLESSGGNVYNALWKESEAGVSSGTHYWKVHVADLKDSIFVGLTSLDKFKKGWAVKGLFYGGPGNLSNGSALIVSGFGKHIKSGDTVGILVVFADEKLKVYFDHNGSSLGQAFDLPASVLNGVFPVVHFSGKGKASISKVSEIPADLTRSVPVYEGIEGDWRCQELNGQPPVTDATLGIFKSESACDGKTYRIGLHVVNRTNGGIRFEGGTWQPTGPMMSTRMLGPPEFMTLEDQMGKLIGSPSTVKLEGTSLVISNTAAGLTSKWKRYSSAPNVVTQDPFH